MKFAHIRASEYFTFAEQIFHSVAVSLARRANFAEKSQVEIRLGFFSCLKRDKRSKIEVIANKRSTFFFTFLFKNH